MLPVVEFPPRYRFLLATFETEDEAIAYAEEAIDKELHRQYWQRPGVSGTELYHRWIDLSVKPFIPGSWFKATEYARMRAPEIALELFMAEDDRR